MRANRKNEIGSERKEIIYCAEGGVNNVWTGGGGGGCVCVPWLHYSKDKRKYHQFSLIQLLSQTLLLNGTPRESTSRLGRANRLSLKALLKQQWNSLLHLRH
jgi:hypothetical protein